MIKYYKLFDVMARRGIKKMKLVDEVGLSSSTLAKLTHNDPVSIDVIDRLCSYLDVQPGEIMEHEKDDIDRNAK